MNYNEAIEYIENTGKFGINLGLQRIKKLCELLGNPEKELKVIHVAGTNGKGSTTAFIASVLKEQGYRVGIYTSPYIERFTERIRINENEIEQEEIAQIITELVPVIDKLVEEGLEPPTEFEIITVAAFKYFYDKKVDFVVLEVGLGGRFDATNVITPLLSVITTISFDHTNILGNTLDKIAYEKAGIIKENIPVVVYPQEKEAMEVIQEVGLKNNAALHLVGEMRPEILMDTEDGIIFNVSGRSTYNSLKIKLLGEHQVMNALTALTALEVFRELGFKLTEEAIYKGFENARWPGRLEIVRVYPHIVLDGGHNIQGVKALVKAAKKYFSGKKIKIVCGMLRDKEYDEMLEELFTLSEDFITVAPDNPRALTAEELSTIIKSKGRNAIASSSIGNAVTLGFENVLDNEVLIFCGSLYMIGAARTIILNRKQSSK
jgi:dihydrofolate synthase / folylpolyglutamate synthase